MSELNQLLIKNTIGTFPIYKDTTFLFQSLFNWSPKIIFLIKNFILNK